MRKIRASAGVAAGALLLLVSGTNAYAAEPSCNGDRETARTLMNEGDQKRERGDLKGALEHFKQADALVCVPSTGLEVANVQIKLGQLLEARETLARVMRIPAKAGEPAPFTAARNAAGDLLSDVISRIPTIQITLQNVPDGTATQVMVDEENVPLSALATPRKVDPGTHSVVVRAGSAEKRESVTVAERETKTATFDFGTTGHDAGETPSGGRSTASKVLMYGGFTVAAIGVGVGSVTGILSLSKAGDLNCKANKCPPSQADQLDSALALGNIATVAFIAGGVGLGVGIVSLLTGKPKAEAASSTAVRTVVGPSYVGLTGAF
jgi:hypothetical protein